MHKPPWHCLLSTVTAQKSETEDYQERLVCLEYWPTTVIPKGSGPDSAIPNGSVSLLIRLRVLFGCRQRQVNNKDEIRIANFYRMD